MGESELPVLHSLKVLMLAKIKYYIIVIVKNIYKVITEPLTFTPSEANRADVCSKGSKHIFRSQKMFIRHLCITDSRT